MEKIHHRYVSVDFVNFGTTFNVTGNVLNFRIPSYENGKCYLSCSPPIVFICEINKFSRFLILSFIGGKNSKLKMILEERILFCILRIMDHEIVEMLYYYMDLEISLRHVHYSTNKFMHSHINTISRNHYVITLNTKLC